MLGAIAGDIFAASYEFAPCQWEDIDLFERHRFFTDDTVLTVATADALLTDGDYARAYREWGRRYPACTYGDRFYDWLHSDHAGPYNSFGNGSAMRVSPVGWAFDTLDETLAEAKRSAAVTHNHPEGIKGAQATAAAIYLARTGTTKQDIRREITARFNYDLDRTIAQIRPDYHFNETCQGSVPEALIAFLDADDFEHTLRLAIYLGGDADTQAAIAGAVAEAFFYRVPVDMKREVQRILPYDMIKEFERFRFRMVKLARLETPEQRSENDPATDVTTEGAATDSGDAERKARPRRRTPVPFGTTPEDVWAWLDENQIRCEPKRTVTIKKIDFDWYTLKGACTVEFDGVPCRDELSLRYNVTSRIGFGLPAVHSPLGAPATYDAYVLSPEARKALREALDSIFPEIRPFGRQKDTGVVIHLLNSTNRDRWPPKKVLDKVNERLADPDFEVTVPVKEE